MHSHSDCVESNLPLFHRGTPSCLDQNSLTINANVLICSPLIAWHALRDVSSITAFCLFWLICMKNPQYDTAALSVWWFNVKNNKQRENNILSSGHQLCINSSSENKCVILRDDGPRSPTCTGFTPLQVPHTLNLLFHTHRHYKGSEFLFFWSCKRETNTLYLSSPSSWSHVIRVITNTSSILLNSEQELNSLTLSWSLTDACSDWKSNMKEKKTPSVPPLLAPPGSHWARGNSCN